MHRPGAGDCSLMAVRRASGISCKEALAYPLAWSDRLAGDGARADRPLCRPSPLNCALRCADPHNGSDALSDGLGCCTSRRPGVGRRALCWKSGPGTLVSSIACQTAKCIGVEVVNAIDSCRFWQHHRLQQRNPAVTQLLAGLDLAGKIVLSDALHTQDDRARQILFEGGRGLLDDSEGQSADPASDSPNPVRPTGFFPLSPRPRRGRSSGSATAAVWRFAA